MRVYVNQNCKKVRNSHVLEITCAYCKSFIANYKKIGNSNLVKMYEERIIDSIVDLNEYHGAIFCGKCNQKIATRYVTKRDKQVAYRLVPSAFNKRKVNL